MLLLPVLAGWLQELSVMWKGTLRVKKITVQVREDHLELLSRARPMNALAELIWNALDAEATEVRVEFVENALSGIETVRILDNGLALPYENAFIAFRNLGGSWKREENRTVISRRFMHGQFGKGRFRAFALGNRAEWTSVYEFEGRRFAYTITGHASAPGEFALTEPEPADAPRGMTVEIADVPTSVSLLRGIKAQQEVTDTFALYLRQYPDVRLVYDGVPIDPVNAEDRSTDIDLGEMVMQNGERVTAAMTVVEWNLPGKRGIVLCDENGFALHHVTPRLLFRGFNYTAYLKSAHFAVLEKEGLLQLEDMTPDARQLLDAARLKLRQHFTLREVERAQETLAMWRETGLYPYRGEPVNRDEEAERRIFDIYAAHLNQLNYFAESNYAMKLLLLKLVRELVDTDPIRVARILDELLAFPEEKQEEVTDLIQA